MRRSACFHWTLVTPPDQLWMKPISRGVCQVMIKQEKRKKKEKENSLSKFDTLCLLTLPPHFGLPASAGFRTLKPASPLVSKPPTMNLESISGTDRSRGLSQLSHLRPESGDLNFQDCDFLGAIHPAKRPRILACKRCRHRKQKVGHLALCLFA